MFKKIIQYSAVLIVITGVSAGLITYAAEVTKPFLLKMGNADLDAAMTGSLAEIYTNIKDYTEVESTFEDPQLLNLYEINTDDGENKYVYNISSEGRNGDIKFLIAYNSDGNIDGVIYISHQETPDIGTVIEEQTFLSSIINQNAKDDPQIDTISGATISSRAVVLGIELSAKHLANEVLK